MTVQSPEASRASTPDVFIGRRKMLDWLGDSYRNLMEGRGRVLLVAGEAGIGKTTLVEHFLDLVLAATCSERVRGKPSLFLLQAKCRSITASGNPYGPFAELLDGIPDTGQEKATEKIKEWGRELGPRLVEGVVPYLGPLLAHVLEMQLGVKGKQVGAATAAGQSYQLLELFKQLCEVCPLLLFIDDLHWADEASINLLFNLARHIPEKPILLIGTYRPHDIVERPGYPVHPLSKVLLELKRYGLHDEMALGQFTLGEVNTYLRKCYPNNRFSSSFVRKLYDETNGVPFFLDQVLRLFADQAIVFVDADGQWTAKSLDTVPIPEGAQAVIEARIQNLDRECRRVLSYASILGEQFRSLILAEILEQRHLDVLTILRALEHDYNLVRQRVDAAEHRVQPNWEFRHAFVQEALYQLLSGDERVELHSLTADALRARFPDIQDELAGELALHCEAAHRYSKAVSYRIAAAKMAYRAQSFVQQAAHCAEGISDWEEVEPAKRQPRSAALLWSGLIHETRRSISLEKEERTSHELLRLARKYSDTIMEIEGCLGLLHFASMNKDTEAVLRHSERAWKAAHKSGQLHHLVRVAGFVAYGLYGVIPEQLRQHLNETLELCRRESIPTLLSKVLQSRGIVAYLDQDDALALTLFREAIEVAKDIAGDDARLSADYPFAGSYYSTFWVVTDCFEWIGRIHRRHGEWHEAIEQFEQVYERKQMGRNLGGMSGLKNVIAETQMRAGALADADRSFKQSWATAQQTDSTELKAMVLSTGISIAMELGENEEAAERLKLFETATADWNAGWVRHKAQMTRAVLYARAGVDREAEKLLTTGLEAAEKEADLGLQTLYTMHLAELHLGIGDLDRASQYADKAVQTATAHQLWDLGDACLIAARVKARLGDDDKAGALIQQASEHFQKKNLPSKDALARDVRQQIGKA